MRRSAGEQRFVGLALTLAKTSPQSFVLRAWARYEDGPSRDVTDEATTRWSSSDPKVLELSERTPGVVSAGRSGGATITVCVGDHHAEWAIDSWEGVLTRLRPPTAEYCAQRLITGLVFPLQIPVDSSPNNSYDGHILEVTAHPAEAAQIIHQPPRWYVKGLRPGPVVIRSEYGTVHAESELEIHDDDVKLTRIGIDGKGTPKSLHLWLGTEATPNVQLQSSTYAPEPERYNVRWSSSAPGVLEVVTAGETVTMRGLAEGEATLTASCLNARSTLHVIVCEEPKIEWF